MDKIRRHPISKSSPLSHISMASDPKEIAVDLSPVIRVYKDGSVERIEDFPYVPPSPEDPATGVSSKDVTISPNVSARLYLPNLNHTTNQKLPILVYFHASGFCVHSAFSSLHQPYLNLLVSESNAIAVSVGYRLAPEHPLPAAYEDCWEALQWVASHKSETNVGIDRDPWLINHGDFNRVFLGGDSAGGNIVHNVAIRVGIEKLDCDLKISGGFLSHPYFLESSEGKEESLPHRLWLFAYPSARGGVDNPMINPFVAGAPSLKEIGCSKLLVCVSGKDELREIGVRYVDAVKGSGWGGEVETEGEDHCFHIFDPDSEKGKNLIGRLASFLMK